MNADTGKNFSYKRYSCILCLAYGITLIALVITVVNYFFLCIFYISSNLYFSLLTYPEEVTVVLALDLYCCLIFGYAELLKSCSLCFLYCLACLNN